MKQKFFLLAAFLCLAALNLDAQTEESETMAQKYSRLSKIAEENPKDWKVQLEVGEMLNDKENEFYNQEKATKYYERIYHLASDYNKEIPDTVFLETCRILMGMAFEKGDADKALLFVDELKLAGKRGLDKESKYYPAYNICGFLINMFKGDCANGLLNMLELRRRVTESNLPGIEHTDIITAFAFDEVMKKYKELFSDKLLEVTLDNKSYVIISMGNWNIEKPFMGFTEGMDKDSLKLMYGEDGVVYDDLHGEGKFNFNVNANGISPQEDVNMRMISITPERRQQLVNAYRNYMKKSKKKKKNN